ncbi:MAG: aminoacyl-tRNA hydrolase [Candidatus Nealsonbacteria bacterium]|nr:aminoacyl-tRNA hydrolase [Candidatus Nealsonbacteria bacterium]
MVIIGLGNPGEKYKNTRHNVGHMVIDELEKALRQAQGEPDGFILAKTDTFMNLSGKAVKSLYTKYKIQNTKYIMVVHDDIDLPIGEFKIQQGRGAAGHKGAQSIIDELGTKDFWRIRIGISPKGGKPENVEKFVLQKFSKEEQKTIEKVIKNLLQEIETRLVDFRSQQ